MNKDEAIKYWGETAEIDFFAMNNLFRKERYCVVLVIKLLLGP